MKRLHLFSIQSLLAIMAVVTVGGLVFAVTRDKASLNHAPAGASNGLSLVKSSSTEQTAALSSDCHIYDKTPVDDSLLISKSCEDISDLWYRDRSGRERFISEAVTDAKFSPNGDKFVYATVDGEVFVETATGKRLAEISRAFDPVWSVEGTTVSFSLVPSFDYPELQQRAIYDLASGSIATASAPQFPSRQSPALTPPKSEQTYDKN